MNISITVVYDSGAGHTKQQAEHIVRGIKSVAGVTCRLLRADEAERSLDTLRGDDAIVFGSPTYMGSVSSRFKSFMDATSKLWMTQDWKNKIAAGFTNSYSMSGDKLNTLIQLVVFSMQHGMIWVGQSELNSSPAGDAGNPLAVNRMGSFLGAMAQSDNASPEETPPEGDLATARAFGRRIAEVTHQFVDSQ